MVNLATNLEQFILPIPICDRDYSLNALIAAVSKSSRGVVALTDNFLKPQGAIWSQNLLRSINQPFIRNSADLDALFWQDYTTEIITKLDCLSVELSLQEFIHDSANSDRYLEEDYFIVDPQGKLLGILDKTRILATVCSTLSDLPITPDREKLKAKIGQDFAVSFSPSTTKDSLLPEKQQVEDRSLQKLNPFFYTLLDLISLPIKVENIKGEVCYQNSRWLTLEKTKYQTVSPLSDRTKSHKQTSIDLGSLQNSYSDRSSSIFSSPEVNSDLEKHHCSTVVNRPLLFSTVSKLQRQIAQMHSSLSELEEEKREREIDVDWNYYSIPVKIENNKIELTNNPNYLVNLAVETSFSLEPKTQKNRRELTDKLKQLQEDLLLDISHDIKSPLTAIVGLASLLKEEKLGQLNFSQIRYSQMIYHSGKKLINLINDFLDLTRLTTKNYQLQPESLDLETFCQQVYDRIAGKFKTSTAIKTQKTPLFPELQLDIDPQAQIAIADPLYLHQILTSLLEVAWQLTSGGELLGISTECWFNWLAITVWNEGGGLEEAQQNSILKGLSRDNNLLTSEPKKQALSLILAQQLARVHGGDISFVSQNNYGSEFTLLLPLGNRQDSVINHSSKDRNNLILIVENKTKVIVDLTEKLKSLGYHYAIARNSSEALYKARCLQPKKIIINPSSLEYSKPSLIQLLRGDSSVCNIPLISIMETQADCDLFKEDIEDTIQFPLNRAKLARLFPPIIPRESNLSQNLTVLRLSLMEMDTSVSNNSILDFVFENLSSSLCHHIIEADSLEQAELLARIWHIDVIIWDGVNLNNPSTYLQSFAKSYILGTIPLITLDTKTTAIANKIGQLSVFPCLLPKNERSIEQLTRAIQIAAGFG